ncbi:MAG: alanine dehydrogenase, partial [Flavobacteriales bacterium]|nr:alanine dehydrogenase [Flavobacteriales bacterium]
MVKLGIIREGKTPPDFRVPLTPAQCAETASRFGIEVFVQSSPIRRFTDDEYRQAGVRVVENVDHCDILLGVKEVPVDMLVPGKTYLFFSHTIKKQPHNAKLLKAILDKKIRLIDYETLKGTNGKRLIGFGRYAGIVGAYEGFRAYGKKTGRFELKSPSQCHDRVEMEKEMANISLPANMKIVVTGFGRVGHGTEEILQYLNFKRVSAESFFSSNFSEPVYLHLDTHEYYERKDFGGFEKRDFYSNPEKYHSTLPDYVKRADLYMACHLWAGGNPVLIGAEALRQPDWKCRTIADISCDTNGPIASTIRSSSIADPLFGYDPATEEECDYRLAHAICVMAIDNLPCELPRDASEDFGNELIRSVFPLLLQEDPDHIIWKATETTLEGELTPHFEYLKDYAAGITEP